jgi:hypothetical protein
VQANLYRQRIDSKLQEGCYIFLREFVPKHPGADKKGSGRGSLRVRPGDQGSRVARDLAASAGG